MKELVSKHGINSFKIYMAYKDDFMLLDDEMYLACQRASELGAIVLVHAENGNIIARVRCYLALLSKGGAEG